MFLATSNPQGHDWKLELKEGWSQMEFCTSSQTAWFYFNTFLSSVKCAQNLLNPSAAVEGRDWYVIVLFCDGIDLCLKLEGTLEAMCGDSLTWSTEHEKLLAARSEASFLEMFKLRKVVQAEGILLLRGFLHRRGAVWETPWFSTSAHLFSNTCEV